MDFSTIEVKRDGAVARLWLNRPDVRNALNGTLIRELAAAFDALAADDPGVRAIVLGGSGKAFCAGADLAFMREIGDLHLGAEPQPTPRRWPACCTRCSRARCR